MVLTGIQYHFAQDGPAAEGPKRGGDPPTDAIHCIYIYFFSENAQLLSKHAITTRTRAYLAGRAQKQRRWLWSIHVKDVFGTGVSVGVGVGGRPRAAHTPVVGLLLVRCVAAEVAEDPARLEVVHVPLLWTATI